MELFLIFFLHIFVSATKSINETYLEMKEENATTETPLLTTVANQTESDLNAVEKSNKMSMISMIAIAPGIAISVMSGKMIYSRRQKKSNDQCLQPAGHLTATETESSAQGLHDL